LAADSLGCEISPAIDGDPRQTAKDKATAGNMARRASVTEALGAADNDKVLRPILLIMEQRSTFAGATAANEVSRGRLTLLNWLGSASENLN
jgi:hypothetical protein